MHSEMGPVWQTPIQRTVRTGHLSVLMTVHRTVLIISPLTFRQHHSSDVVYWMRRGNCMLDWCCQSAHMNASYWFEQNNQLSLIKKVLQTGYQIQIQFYWTCRQKAKDRKAKQTIMHCTTEQYKTRQDMKCNAMPWKKNKESDIGLLVKILNTT